MEKLEKQLNIYKDLLIEWNEKINLTAITDEKEIMVKHFEDSLSLLKYVDIPKNEKVIDIGTGAGFPGMVIKLARQDLDVTLLDGHKKRFIFLEDLQNTLGIKCNNLHARAEEAAKKHREEFFIATARAVASLNVLAEYCLGFVKVGGYFVAMKGDLLEEELTAAKNAIKIMGGKILEVKKFNLSDGSKRSLVLIKKISQTPTKYPRISAKISKQPL